MGLYQRLRRRLSPRGVVQGLWIGDRLGPMGSLSIRSFLANGYRYHLYTYGPVHNVPRGAELLDANTILPASRIFKYRDHDSYAGYSNHFRYRLLLTRGGTWADCDVVCLRPLELPEFSIAQELNHHGQAQVATCLLRAPRGNELMRRAEKVCDAADTATLKWGDTGFSLLSPMVRELGAERALLPVETICPVSYMEWETLVSEDPCVKARVAEQLRPARAVHLWNEMFRRHGRAHLAAPARSMLAELHHRYRT